MAYTDIALSIVDRDGPTEDTAATQTAAIADGGHVNGHSFLNDGSRTFISFRNGAGAAVIYVYIPKLVDGQAVTMKTYNLLAATDGMLGPFPTDIYNQEDGDVHFGSDGAANLTYLPWRLS